MPYLLDTNACIQAMRGNASVVRAMAAHAPADLIVSSITCYELFAGVEKCAQPERERGKVESFLGAVSQLTFDVAAAAQAARIRARLEARGEMIGPYDVLLAGHAMSVELTLVTANTSEFSRVAGLVVENWE